MNNNILFSERQQFRQWWIWLMLIGINGLFLYGIYEQVGESRLSVTRLMSNASFFFTSCLCLLITGLFISFRLDTQIKENGIYVKVFPFHLSFKIFQWDKISKLFVRQYNPIGEYGGWGLRLGLFGKGKAYNVSGNQGLQIVFTDNKRLLIGTKKPAELRDTLIKLDKLNYN